MHETLPLPLPSQLQLNHYLLFPSKPVVVGVGGRISARPELMEKAPALRVPVGLLWFDRISSGDVVTLPL